ncbi:MAG TPA: flagellar M-ring protein FliF, partial [Alphaproteobacteria bacterium]|nr:flagellar M-ring protein FliF [Alphaproteobacteria bacterium]
MGGAAQVVEAFKAMGVARLGAMAGMTAALFGFFAYIVMGISEEPMSLLYAGLDSKDASAIIAKLDAGRIPYKLESGGSTIMVASDQALRLHIPSAGGVPDRT